MEVDTPHGNLLNKLPVEIWKMIFDYIKVGQWVTPDKRVLNHPDEFLEARRVLHHASLACRLLHHMATPLLYEEVVFLRETPGVPTSRAGWAESLILFFRTLYSAPHHRREMVKRICCAITFACDKRTEEGAAGNNEIRKTLENAWARVAPSLVEYDPDALGLKVGKLAELAGFRRSPRTVPILPSGGHVLAAILLLSPCLKEVQLASPDQCMWYFYRSASDRMRGRMKPYEHLSRIVEEAMEDDQLYANALRELTSFSVFIHPFLSTNPSALPGLCPVFFKAPNLARFEVSHLYVSTDTWVWVPRNKSFRELRLLNVVIDGKTPSPPLLNVVSDLQKLTITLSEIPDKSFGVGPTTVIPAWQYWNELLPDILNRCSQTLADLDLRGAKILTMSAWLMNFVDSPASVKPLSCLRSMLRLQTLHVDISFLLGAMEDFINHAISDVVPPNLECLKIEEVWHGPRDMARPVDLPAYRRRLYLVFEALSKSVGTVAPSLRKIVFRYFSSIRTLNGVWPDLGMLEGAFRQHGVQFILVAGRLYDVGQPLEG